MRKINRRVSNRENIMIKKKRTRLLRTQIYKHRRETKSRIQCKTIIYWDDESNNIFIEDWKFYWKWAIFSLLKSKKQCKSRFLFYCAKDFYIMKNFRIQIINKWFVLLFFCFLKFISNNFVIYTQLLKTYYKDFLFQTRDASNKSLYFFNHIILYNSIFRRYLYFRR